MRSGIAGIVYPDAFQVTHLLTPILNTLAHRGSPLLREEFTYKNIQIGITGGQLAHSSTGVAAIDGRLNHVADLKAQLEAQGFHFKTDNHAELVLYAYELWGTSFLEHISGNFALTVIDKRDGKLLLARDRLGKNPVYWFQGPQHFIFSSELKGMLASGVVPQTPSTEGIAHYLYLGYIPQDLSPIKGVNKLLPSHYLQYNSDQSKIINPYWSLSSFLKKKTEMSPASFICQFDELLTSTVCEQVPPSTPFGCLVSGGIGSASVAYYLQKCVSEKDYDAYTVAFQGENMEDMAAAEDVTRTLHLKHHCDIITPADFLDDFTKIIWYLDEPLADPNTIATWRLGKLAHSSKVVFSGMGSDEFLAGHSRYSTKEQTTSVWSQLLQSSSQFVKTYLLPLISAVSREQAYKILRHLRSNPSQYNYISQNAVFSEHELSLAAPRIASQFDIHVFLHKFHRLPEISSVSTVASLLYLDIKTRLADNFILQYERLLTANGLQWRTPFISKEIVEFLARVIEPERLAEKDTFFIMKNILKNVFPVSFLYRPKRTRKDFLKSWVTRSELPELFKLLQKGTLVESGIISDKWLQKQLSSLDQQKEAFPRLWSILVLELWFRIYINQPIQSSPPNITVRDLLLQI